jgi:hypothetical protein
MAAPGKNGILVVWNETRP